MFKRSGHTIYSINEGDCSIRAVAFFTKGAVLFNKRSQTEM